MPYTLQNSAHELRLLRSSLSKKHRQENDDRFTHDITSIRPHHIDDIVEAIYDDLDGINTALSAASQTLAQTLGFGNTTSNHDIILSNYDVIKGSTSLITLDFGTDNQFYASTDSGTGDEAFLYLVPTNADLGFDANYVRVSRDGISLTHSSEILLNSPLTYTLSTFQLGGSGASADLRLYNSSNNNYVKLTAGVTSASYDVRFPTAQGSAGQTLSNNGSGVLSWVTPSSGGNETLAQTLVLGNTTDGSDIIVSDGDLITSYNATISETFGNGNWSIQHTGTGTYVSIDSANVVLNGNGYVYLRSAATGLGQASALNGVLVVYNSTNNNTITIQTPVTSASYTVTLPLAQGTAGQSLKNDGAGNLYWG